MGQKITVTESQLRDMVVKAVNESMEESFFGDMFRGVSQAYNNYKNDAGVQDAKAQQQNAKQTMKTANKTNKQISNASQKDLAYLQNMQQRYGDYSIKQGLDMLISQIKKAASSAGESAQNAQAAYNTAKGNTQQAKQNRSQNLINKISGTQQQPQQQQQPENDYQKAMKEAVSKVVNNVINEIVKK